MDACTTPLCALACFMVYIQLDLKKETDLWLAGSISNLPNWHGITLLGNHSYIMHTYL